MRETQATFGLRLGMDARLLTDSIVRQTTVLIAQISTAAGIRAPLAQLADQVFLSLSQELERQGVGRTVVADMFGLALRSYQRKVQRLAEGNTVSATTLWESVLEFVETQGSATRLRVLERFKYDDEGAVVAVLSDLAGSGLISATGRGSATLYRVTSETDRSAIETTDAVETLSHMVWGEIFRQPGINLQQLKDGFTVDPERIDQAIDLLLGDGRIQRGGGGEEITFRSGPFFIPAGSVQGWEAAVFDHFQAMATAIAAKLNQRNTDAPVPNVGGSTLHFEVHPRHPRYDETLNTLTRLREQLNELWTSVCEYNDQYPVNDDEVTRVTVYVGENVRTPEKTDVPVVTRSRGNEGE